MAYAQVGIYGMNKKVGLLSFPQDENRFDKPYSNETARLIDDEARSLLDAAYARTVAIVAEKRELVQALADELLSKEVRYFVPLGLVTWTGHWWICHAAAQH